MLWDPLIASRSPLRSEWRPYQFEQPVALEFCVPTLRALRCAALWSLLQIRVREDQEAILAGLSPSEFDALLDLRPFMQRSPYIVNEDASLSRGYR